MNKLCKLLNLEYLVGYNWIWFRVYNEHNLKIRRPGEYKIMKGTKYRFYSKLDWMTWIKFNEPVIK